MCIVRFLCTNTFPVFHLVYVVWVRISYLLKFFFGWNYAHPEFVYVPSNNLFANIHTRAMPCHAMVILYISHVYFEGASIFFERVQAFVNSSVYPKNFSHQWMLPFHSCHFFLSSVSYMASMRWPFCFVVLHWVFCHSVFHRN